MISATVENTFPQAPESVYIPTLQKHVSFIYVFTLEAADRKLNLGNPHLY